MTPSYGMGGHAGRSYWDTVLEARYSPPPPKTDTSKGIEMPRSGTRRARDLRKVTTAHRPVTAQPSALIKQQTVLPLDDAKERAAKAKAMTMLAGLEIYPAASYGGPGAPAGKCLGSALGCEACGFSREPGEHCHKYEMCPQCAGVGSGSCATAVKLATWAKQEGLA
jgi:hypothetical protein